MNGSLKALLFDVDGTLADTEDAHRQAFNSAFADAGLDWRWDRQLYTYLLSVTGGKARIRFYLEGADPAYLDRPGIDDEIAALHAAKTEHYVGALHSGGVPLRPGIERLLREARAAGLVLAIATTTTPVNIRALIESNLGKAALDWFAAIGAGDCVERLKPAPDVYFWVLDKLGLEAGACLALEDSANGLTAALAAGVGCVVTTCPYTAHHAFPGAIAVIDGLGEPERPFAISAGDAHGHGRVDIDLLRRWHGKG